MEGHHELYSPLSISQVSVAVKVTISSVNSQRLPSVNGQRSDAYIWKYGESLANSKVCGRRSAISTLTDPVTFTLDLPFTTGLVDQKHSIPRDH